MARPAPDEHDDYFSRYIDLVPDGPILETLERQFETTMAVLGRVPADREDFRYEAFKWSIREVIGHCIDTERLLGFRGLWFARGQTGELPSFDPDVCDDHATHDDRELRALCDEWSTVRRSTLSMFQGFDEPTFGRRGTASGKVYSVRSIAWILAGHELHHRRVLAERYGVE